MWPIWGIGCGGAAGDLHFAGGRIRVLKEFGTVNEMDCRDPGSVLVSELGNWRVDEPSPKPKK